MKNFHCDQKQTKIVNYNLQVSQFNKLKVSIQINTKDIILLYKRAHFIYLPTSIKKCRQKSTNKNKTLSGSKDYIETEQITDVNELLVPFTLQS